MQAGGGRITQPERLRTITNGITFKVSDAINKEPKPARPGSRLLITAGPKKEIDGRVKDSEAQTQCGRSIYTRGCEAATERTRQKLLPREVAAAPRSLRRRGL